MESIHHRRWWMVMNVAVVMVMKCNNKPTPMMNGSE